MSIDLDTFVTTVYTAIDDLYQGHIVARITEHRGRPPRVSDSEVLTLLVCAQWLDGNERRFLRYAHTYWQSYFPEQLSQSAFNRRVRRLGGICSEVMLLVAQQLTIPVPAFEIADSAAVPLASLNRGKHHRRFGDEAAIGRGGSDRHFYYGCQLVLLTAPDGVITGMLVGPANTEERWLLDAVLGWRADPTEPLWNQDTIPLPPERRSVGYVGPTGPRWSPATVGKRRTTVYLVDNGFTGEHWHTHWQTDYAATVITFKDYPLAGAAARAAHHHQRFRIETVYAALKDVFHLERPGGHTMWGVVTRIIAKCTAFNCALWMNRRFGRPSMAIATLFPG
jgi:hypothetical protein